MVFNTVQNSGNVGIAINSSNTNNIGGNNMISNSIQAWVGGSSSGNTLNENYWDNWSAPPNCVNATFDYFCDAPYVFTGGNDAQPLVLSHLFDRADWTWYDGQASDDWILLGTRPGIAIGFFYKLIIGGSPRMLPAFPVLGPGYVPPGKTLYAKYDGIMGGPVVAQGDVDAAGITSQRVLWPKGGSSLEEVPGINVLQMNSRYYWPWYDMMSPGFSDWVLVSNPNNYQVHYTIKIGNAVVDNNVIPAGGRVTPTFPGKMGGPVVVDADDGAGHRAYVIASQRVLTGGGSAFNELPGQPADGPNGLNGDYVWTWYDMTSGAKNWVLIANPPDAAGPIYYDIWIGSLTGAPVKSGGPIAPGANETPVFPGVMGGPVRVKTYPDAAHTTLAKSIVSQRSLWGPSFEEVLGKPYATLAPSYYWTWYDQKSAGARNWVLVANPSTADTITATVSFTDQDTGMPVSVSSDIAPTGRWTPMFPGRMGGPVVVRAYRAGGSWPADARNVITSQRVLWNGYFNEVWGQ